MNCLIIIVLQPPKELQIEVRVLEDCGEIMTENGPLRLAKNAIVFVRRLEGLSFLSDLCNFCITKQSISGVIHSRRSRATYFTRWGVLVIITAAVFQSVCLCMFNCIVHMASDVTNNWRKGDVAAIFLSLLLYGMATGGL